MKPLSIAQGVETRCWNRIGVAGDRSCSELVRVVHCRNCEVFGAGARELLDRPLSSSERALWTSHFAQPEVYDASEQRSVLIFRLQSEWLALPTRVIEEVVTVRAVHSLPHRRSPALLGLVNVGGQLVPCVSLSSLLGIESADNEQTKWKATPRMLVLGEEAHRFVAAVDEVHGTERIFTSQLVSAPTTVSKVALSYSTGVLPWKERAVGCLDHERLFQTLERCLS